MGHSEPSQLPAETLAKIISVAQDAVRAIGIRNGPAHTEIIVTADGPKIVELGARLGGDNITTRLVPLSTGVDMVRSCIELALGEKPDMRQTIWRGAAIRYLDIPPGTIVAISGVREACQVDGVREIGFSKGVGDEVEALSASTDRVGYVIAQSDDAPGAIRACEDAMRLIHILIGGRDGG
jgi:biotin carboxylase